MRTGIIYGEDWAISLTAPEDWILDNQSGVNQELHAVFYPRGTTWVDAKTTMYVSTSRLSIESQKTIEDLMDYDAEYFKSHYSDVMFTNAEEIQITENVIARVRYFWSESYGNHEAVAYVDASKIGVMIVLSSRETEEFYKSLESFEELVKSYSFVWLDADENHK